MATTKDDKTPKVMDVARPGRSAPSSSSKPIIVSNRPILKQDPMMASPDGLEAVPATPAEPGIVSHTARTLNVVNASDPAPVEVKPVAAPLANSLTTLLSKAEAAKQTPIEPKLPVEPTVTDTPEQVSTNNAPSEAAKPENPEVEEVRSAQPPIATSEPAPDASKPDAAKGDSEATKPSDDSSDAAEAPADATTTSDDQLAPNQALEEAKRKEEEALAAQLAEQEKIIASKQYYLPIYNVQQRRGLDRVLLILALVLVLALVWADVVLDAGIIHINGVQALTHFFR